MRLAVASTDMRAVTRAASDNNNAASYEGDVLQGMGDNFDEPGEWDLEDGAKNRGEGEDLYFDAYE